MIKPIRNNIRFVFIEDTSDGAFENVTSWGFEIKNKKEDVKTPRWGIVESVGADVKTVKPGDYILINSLMWTPKYSLDGEKFWFTNEEKLIGYSKEKPKGLT